MVQGGRLLGAGTQRQLSVHHRPRTLCRAGQSRPTVCGAVPAPERKVETPQAEAAPSDAAYAALKAQVEALQRENAALKARIAELGDDAPAPDAAAAAAPERATKDATAPQGLLFFTKDVASQLESGIQWPEAGERFWTRSARKNECLLEDNSPCRRQTIEPDRDTLSVVHMTAEMAPIAKVGGLGDVITGLAKATLQRGHNVQVMLPFYSCLPRDALEGLQHVADFDCPKGSVWDGEFRQGTLRTSVHRARIDGVPVLLVAPADRNESRLFTCDRIYGGGYNETEAYLYFCRAGLEALQRLNMQPDILHLHEWQCSAAAMLYWEVYNNRGLSNQRIVLTIHNMDNSGECRQEEFSVTGFPGEVFASVDKALDERTIGHNPERLCLMKGGMVYSNAITTVSPTYAREAREGGAAGFLRTVLAEPHVAAKFSGVLNGIDTDAWCPSRDPTLPAAFNSEYPKGKALCKKYLQKGLGLDVNPNKPLVACITRLVPQKGIHLIRHSVHKTAELGGQFVLLGSGHADGDFRRMGDNEFRDSKDVRLLVMYSEELAHILYAAADYVIVPSMFEPCGLTQLIAMRYGALPVVRKTGGLADTVLDLDQSPKDGNGFVFDGADEGSCGHALERAFALHKSDRKRFDEVSRRNMDIDWSWAQPAASYLEIYRRVAAF